MSMTRQEAAQAELDRRERMEAAQAELDRRSSMEKSNPINEIVGGMTDVPKTLLASSVEGNRNLLSNISNAIGGNSPLGSLIIDIMKNKMEGPLNQTKPIRQMAENINQFVQKPEEALGVERAHGEPFYTPLGLTHAIGNYFTGGELGALTKAGDLIPLAAKTIPYVGKHLPGLIDRAAIGAGAELNEEQPSMRGAIEKSLISMLLPPAVSAVAGAIRNPIKTGNSLQ